MLTPMQAVASIAVMAVVTFLTRALPFLLFDRGSHPPKLVLYLGRVLPPAIIAMLIVYCLRGVSFAGLESWLPPLLAVVLVVVLHLWRHNNLLSIFGGTVFYMVLIQAVDWQAVENTVLVFFN
ncbi:branched-chain amino acid transporter AzlD [Flavonifractor sp. An135]|nr:AzlD domain-containing protein [Flavonifractor sp. An135]OUQ22292.1 branched-chain amino acid transporter AzlD [Flavonifractor sp. An135]